jgi:hypothetical protein
MRLSELHKLSSRPISSRERNLMRICLSITLGIFVMTFVAACQSKSADTAQSAAAARPAADFKSDVTIREIMQSMVAPRADTIWNAVSTNVTSKGVEEKAPKTDEDWQAIRHDAVTILEATNTILIPGRHVARPGDKAEDPKVQLSPEQIEALISKDRENWTKFAHGLYDATMVAMKAIDAKNTMALLDAGNGIDEACEKCHLQYWYPNEAKASAEKTQ